MSLTRKALVDDEDSKTSNDNKINSNEKNKNSNTKQEMFFTGLGNTIFSFSFLTPKDSTNLSPLLITSPLRTSYFLFVFSFSFLNPRWILSIFFLI